MQQQQQVLLDYFDSFLIKHDHQATSFFTALIIIFISIQPHFKRLIL